MNNHDVLPILVVGSAAYDTLETPHGHVKNVLGGSAFYFSAAASRLAEVKLVAVVGSDFSQKDIEFLNERSVDLSGLEVREGDTFRWGGRYDADPNKRETLFTQLGVFQDFEPKIPETFTSVPLVFLGNIHPALQLEVLRQVVDPQLVVTDTMNFWISSEPQLVREVISQTDVLIINDEEAMELTSKRTVIESAEELLNEGLEALIIKKGQHGAVLFHGEDVFFVPAFPVRKVIDPTGAGDTFAGAFLGYLAKNGWKDRTHWKRALVQASVIASFVVEDFSLNRVRDLSKEEENGREERFMKMISLA